MKSILKKILSIIPIIFISENIKVPVAFNNLLNALTNHSATIIHFRFYLFHVFVCFFFIFIKFVRVHWTTKRKNVKSTFSALIKYSFQFSEINRARLMEGCGVELASATPPITMVIGVDWRMLNPLRIDSVTPLSRIFFTVIGCISINIKLMHARKCFFFFYFENYARRVTWI